MESLKDIIAGEMTRPKELLVKTKEDVTWVIAFVEVLKKEVRNYLADFMGGGLLSKRAENSKEKLLQREQQLQTSIEILRQTLGEEWDAVGDDWPEEYIHSLREMDTILDRLIGKKGSTGYISFYGKLVQEAKSEEDIRAILPHLERIRKSLDDLMHYVAVEETVFQRDVQLAINNHVGKDFKQHAAVYAGEIASTWNNYYRSKWKKKEVEVKGYVNEFEREHYLYFPKFIQTQLSLIIYVFERENENLPFKKKYQVEVVLFYDVTSESFSMTATQIGFGGATHSYEPTYGKYDSIDKAFEQLKKWFLH